MRVTVAICTWNRARLLELTLGRMSDLRIPAGVEWEVIVVNNNSTDSTEQLVESFAGRLPVQHIIERQQGQSHARNRAHSVSTGDLILWTDDDVLVDPNWIAAYVDAASRWPTAGYFGGRIVPWFEHDPPEWLAKNEKLLAGMLVARDLGPVEGLFPAEEWPYGANMAFRRAAVAGNLFDPNLGLIGDNAIRKDETEYCRRLQQSGVQGVWVPAASVQHWVGASRMTLEYVAKYYQGYGRGKVRVDGPSEGRAAFGAPLWTYRKYADAMVRYLWKRFRGREDWLLSYIDAAEARGLIVENRAQRGATT
jgi:glycosyltransferase involved in cell wall biosynthesis